MKNIFLLTILLVTSNAHANDTRALVDRYLVESFKAGENQDLARLKQDLTQRECSMYRNQPPQKIAIALLAREKSSIQYPADGKLLGDWKQGEKLVKTGFASRIGKIEPDKPDASRGGNCYACHVLDPKEVAAGNLGPSLRDYGRIRGQDESVVRYTYDKIYNAQSLVPCSSMPRLGYHGILSPKAVADIIAYLLDADSPLNK